MTNPPPLNILLLCRKADMASMLTAPLAAQGHQVSTLSIYAGALGALYADPPTLILAHLTANDRELLSLIASLKEDCYFSTVPVVALIEREEAEALSWEECPVDDFLFLPFQEHEFFTRISISVRRMDRVFDNNPLTRLPGNTSIQRAVEKSLGTRVAVCYADLNHFKPFNDVYGFSRGDEVLRMLARIIFNAVRENGGGFVGHIGGDDFVFIVPLAEAEAISSRVIANFTAIAADLFDEQQRADGYFIGTNRQGKEERIPLLGLSIAVVPVNRPKFSHYGKVAEVAAEMKKHAKRTVGSTYVIDRRQN